MTDNCGEEEYTLKLDELTEKTLTVYLYKDIENIEEVHQKLINKELPCCIVKSDLVLDLFQLAVAANKAALNEKYGQMVTRSLFTEIIFCLSPSKNISQSLSTFGISNDALSILVLLVHNEEEKEHMQKLVFESIKGERIPVSRLSKFSNLLSIKKTYKVGEEELKVSSLLDSIISRISDKGLK